MTAGARPFDRISSVGGIYAIAPGGDPIYVGSCAALGLPTHFVTAAHCVIGQDRERLAVNHFGQGKNPYSRVRAIEVYERCDIAVLETEVEEPRWVEPFTAVAAGTRMGESVTAIGSPVGILTEARKESLRVIRGFVQRPFFYTGRLDHEYPAYELSFAAPPGLSGAPMFSDHEPRVLRGVMTENFQSYTVVESEETIDASGEFRRTESREVVTFGVAANVWHALEFLQHAIPVENLNAADQPAP